MARGIRATRRKRVGRRAECRVCGCPDVRWLAPKEVAAVMPISLRAVRRLLAEGRLPGIRIGGAWMVDHDALDRHILKGREAWVREQ